MIEGVRETGLGGNVSAEMKPTPPPRTSSMVAIFYLNSQRQRRMPTTTSTCGAAARERDGSPRHWHTVSL